MTTIRPATMEDLLHASLIVAGFRKKERTVSTPQKREMALRPLSDGSPSGIVYMVGQSNSPMGYMVLIFIWSIKYGGLEAVVEEVYFRHSIRGKGIGNSILKKLYHTMAAHGVNSLSLEVNQKNYKATQFYKTLRFRLCQNYKLIAMEV